MLLNKCELLEFLYDYGGGDLPFITEGGKVYGINGPKLVACCLMFKEKKLTSDKRFLNIMDLVWEQHKKHLFDKTEEPLYTGITLDCWRNRHYNRKHLITLYFVIKRVLNQKINRIIKKDLSVYVYELLKVERCLINWEE